MELILRIEQLKPIEQCGESLQTIETLLALNMSKSIQYFYSFPRDASEMLISTCSHIFNISTDISNFGWN